MKKRLFVGLAAVAACMVAVSAYAQSATAYSSTAVGVIKKAVPSESYNLISIPLNSADGGEMLFKETPFFSLPNNSAVMVWNVTNATWESHTKQSRGGWGAFSNAVVNPGQPLFVYNYSSDEIPLIFSGTVPDEPSMGIGIPAEGYQMIANPYPVPMRWGDTDICKNSANNSAVMRWDVESNSWESHTKQTRGGWGSFSNAVIQPGEGLFFYEYGQNGYVWTVEKPYSWPE